MNNSAADLDVEIQLFEELSSSYTGGPSAQVQQEHLAMLHAEQLALAPQPGASITQRAMLGLVGTAAAAIAIALFGMSAFDDRVSTTATTATPTTTEIIERADGPAEDTSGGFTIEDGVPILGETFPPTTAVRANAVAASEPTAQQTDAPDAFEGDTAPEPSVTTPATQPGEDADQDEDAEPGVNELTAPNGAPPVNPVPTTTPSAPPSESTLDDSPETTIGNTDSAPPTTLLETSLGDEPFDITELECGGLAVTLGGSNGDDILVGTSGPDVIFGGQGADTIYGLDGDDVICGGNGDDAIDAGPGSDVAFGENGLDTFIGTGNDTFHQDRGDGPVKKIPNRP